MGISEERLIEEEVVKWLDSEAWDESQAREAEAKAALAAISDRFEDVQEFLANGGADGR